jgi:perosamine synthetase
MERVEREVSSNFIPVNEPALEGNEKTYLLDCIETGWISGDGPYVSRFEAEFAARVGRKHGVAVANGSVALHVAVEALELGSGDEVILPTFTIISCAAAIVRSGAAPVLVDCDPLTFNMDCRQVANRITPRTKAVMAVHLYGLPVDIQPIITLASEHGLVVIEDAAQMHGQTYRGRPCGSFGDLSTFSFYSNKHVTTGEGGMILTDDDNLASRCRGLRNHCMSSDRRFVHEELGWNFRMSNLQAAVGVAQLERLDVVVARKRAIGALYDTLLGDDLPIQRPLPATDYAQNAYWAYAVVLKPEAQLGAPEVIKRMASQGIGCRPFFWPMHEQPALRKRGFFIGETYAHAERVARSGLYLPSSPTLTDADVERVCDIFRHILQ